MNLESLLKEALDQHLSDQTPPHLVESIGYSLLSPGKRIRPRLLLATAEMLKIPPKSALPAALALEMVHCFTLVHDDLPCMDNDDFRRGLPTNHKKFGESVALLAGDGLMALAVDVFLDTPLSPPLVLSGLKSFCSAMGPRGVIGGQAAESLLGKNSRLDDLKSMHSQKTGALFAAALLVPKEFAGISDSSEEGEIIHSFAREIGLAFQVADDLEDRDQDEKTGTAPFTSVLHYLTAEEAGRITLNQLNQASQRIRQKWSDSCASLLKISEEVAQKIEAALP